jgi:transcription antitermination factor NusB
VGRRRKAREVALQLLYQLDLRDERQPAAYEAEFWTDHPADSDTQRFASRLVRGAKHHQEEVDGLITQYTEHWDLDRMAVVDRNLLRLAVYELLWHPEVPAKVAINEAIEIAKKFGTQESGRFINGILDRIHKELRPAS